MNRARVHYAVASKGVGWRLAAYSLALTSSPTFQLSIPEGEGYSKKFYTGRLLPEVQTFTLLYTLFDRKGTPFVYLP